MLLGDISLGILGFEKEVLDKYISQHIALSVFVDDCCLCEFLIPEFGYAENFWVAPLECHDSSGRL